MKAFYNGTFEEGDDDEEESYQGNEDEEEESGELKIQIIESNFLFRHLDEDDDLSEGDVSADPAEGIQFNYVLFCSNLSVFFSRNSKR